MTPPSKIFISYARADGKTLALNLQQQLTDLGFSAWLDTREITGGDDWFAQIKKAIDESEYVVLVATPAALASDNVRDEWRYARKIGVRVYPIIYPEKPIDFNQLPHHISKRHFYHSDKTWDSFIDHLRAPYEREPVPFMAESLPAHFVNRPQIEAQLLKYLLSDDRHQSVAITTALKGSGGFGKTTMAQAICHHDVVYDTFLNGILWVTLGENPDVLLALKKLYKALTGKDGSFSDTEEGGRMLGDQLADKNCLIVIDDVWNIAHLRPFLVGGERCARLITTRDVDIARKSNAKTPIEVDEMRPDEARALLRSGIEGLSDTILDALAKRLGYWALMLQIANGMMHTRQLATEGTWADAHAHIIKLLDKRGVKAIHTDDDNQRKQGADGVLDVSLGLLKSPEKTHVCELGIFKDDQDVPVSSVMALWDMDDVDAEDLLTKFARLSLIKYRSSTASIRLHDVVREYFLNKLPDVVAVHDQLLCGYGDPYTLPDKYAWRFYAYHLAGANQLAELRPLLLSYRWLDMKLRQTDPNALLDDCDVWLGRGKDESIRLIRSAISMSAHVLDKDKNALAHQLAGRLMHYYREVDEIRAFLDVVMTTPNNLFPAFPDSEYDIMNPAGGMMLRTMEHELWVTGALELCDGKLLSWSDDNTLRLWDVDGILIATLTGHVEYVRGAAQLTDGRILSWSGDNTLRLWGADGLPIRTLTGHTERVDGAVQLEDGRLLSWGWDATLRLWDVDGTPIATMTGHTESVRGAVQLGDGRLLSWSWDATLRLWDVDGTPIAILTGHTNWVTGALELRDGRLFSWSKDSTLRLWDVDGTPIATLTGHVEDVTGALELRDGRLFSWSKDSTLRLWDVDGTPIATLTGHVEDVTGALELRDGRLFSWSKDSTLRLWDVDGTPIATLTGHVEDVTGALELDDGRLMSWAGKPYSESKDSTLRLWDVDGTPIATLRGHTGSVYGALQLGDGRILSWSGDNTFRLWGADGSPIATLTGHTERVDGALELDDGLLLSWSGDATLRLWDVDGTSIATLTGHMGRVWGVMELGDGRLLSWGDATLRLWDADGLPIATIAGHTDRVAGAVQLADGRVLSWSNDKTLRLWNSDGAGIATLTGHTESVFGAVELGDGRLLSWSGDATLRLWDVDGTPIATLRGHTESVRGAVELADGRLLSWAGKPHSESKDSTLRLWDVDGTPIATLRGHTDVVRGALELGDGRILSWSGDATLRLWDADGTPIATLTGNTREVRGAMALRDGQILSWSWDESLHLWDGDGTPIAVLEQSYDWGNRQIIAEWAKKHGYTLDDFYPPEKDLLMAGGRVQHSGTDLIITDPKTSEAVHTFYGDAPFYGGVIVLEGGRVLLAGDSAGRVVFLRWVGEDGK